MASTPLDTMRTTKGKSEAQIGDLETPVVTVMPETQRARGLVWQPPQTLGLPDPGNPRVCGTIDETIAEITKGRLSAARHSKTLSTGAWIRVRNCLLSTRILASVPQCRSSNDLCFMGRLLGFYYNEIIERTCSRLCWDSWRGKKWREKQQKTKRSPHKEKDLYVRTAFKTTLRVVEMTRRRWEENMI